MAITLPRRSDARKGRQPTAPDGSKAHEAAESKEMEQEEETSGSPEGEEGSESYRNGSKKDYRGRPKPSRQRSAKGAGNTKAPMDSDCGCGSKKGGCSCKGKKDGGMGGPGELYSPSTAAIRQKNARDSSCGMRRGDSLTVHEYLAACDLGIQNQPTGYIRARLDATERLDLKCGAGSISQGEKCTKGTAQATPQRSRITLTGKETGIFSRERIKREGYYGHSAKGDPFSRKGEAKRYGTIFGTLGALAGGVYGATSGQGVKGALIGAAAGGAIYGGLGAVTGAATAQANRVTSRAANRSLQQEQFEKPIAAAYKKKQASMKAAGASRQQLNEHSMATAMKLAQGYDRIRERTRGKYGADSIWAEGFQP